MDFDIILCGFWLLLCSSIRRTPKPPGTKRNNGKQPQEADAGKLGVVLREPEIVEKRRGQVCLGAHVGHEHHVVWEIMRVLQQSLERNGSLADTTFVVPHDKTILEGGSVWGAADLSERHLNERRVERNAEREME